MGGLCGRRSGSRLRVTADHTMVAYGDGCCVLGLCRDDRGCCHDWCMSVEGAWARRVAAWFCVCCDWCVSVEGGRAAPSHTHIYITAPYI